MVSRGDGNDLLHRGSRWELSQAKGDADAEVGTEEQDAEEAAEGDEQGGAPCGQ
jgi:hypothetical protein